MKVNSVGVYVSIEIPNPNFNDAGLVLSKQAQQEKQIEANGVLLDVGSGCQFVKEDLIGKVVYFRPGSVVDIMGSEKDQKLVAVLPETAIHSWTEN